MSPATRRSRYGCGSPTGAEPGLSPEPGSDAARPGRSRAGRGVMSGARAGARHSSRVCHASPGTGKQAMSNVSV
jgi:hypothetical protein